MAYHCRNFSQRDFADLLADNEVAVDVRTIGRWLERGQIGLISGDLENALEHHKEWGPGGHHRWNGTTPASGYMTVGETCEQMGLSHGGVYYRLDKDLESVVSNGRRFISLESIKAAREAGRLSRRYDVIFVDGVHQP